MTDYTELLELLRYCSSQSGCIGCKLSEAYDCTADLTRDAAAAIEALQAEQKKTVTQIFGEEQQEWEEYCTGLMNRIMELKAQLPKRGEWVWKHRHHGGFKTAKGKCECGRDVYAQIDERYETDDPYCPFCGVMNDSIHLNYCPNCGAKMNGEQNVE